MAKKRKKSSTRSVDLKHTHCVTLEAQLFTLVDEYHRAALANGPRWPADTVRELMWMGLMNKPGLAALQSARVSVERELHTWAIAKLKRALTAIQLELNQITSLAAANMDALGQMTATEARGDHE